MNADHQAFLELILMLEEESGIYGQMADLLEQERHALLHLAASDLSEVCSQKETLGLRIKALDESRKVMSERMARRYGILPEKLTVTELTRFAPADLAGRLDRVKVQLRAQAERCKTINDYNSRAARRGIDLVSGAINHLLAEADPAGRVYQKKGNYRPTAAHAGPAVISREV